MFACGNSAINNENIVSNVCDKLNSWFTLVFDLYLLCCNGGGLVGDVFLNVRVLYQH